MQNVLSSQLQQRGNYATNTTEIDIWIWSLKGSPPELTALEDLLSADEIERAQRFVKPIDSLRFIAARGTLRKILSLYCQKDARNLSFNYNKYGKPELDLNDVHSVNFNLSHSGNYAVLAVSNQCELGIDIEEIKPFREDIAARFFSDRECAALANMNGEDYFDGFYRCWTRKEAFVKAHGTGLTLPLNSFDVTVQKFLDPKIMRLNGVEKPWSEWKLMNFNMLEGYAGAIVAKTADLNVQLRYRDLKTINS